MNYEEAIKSEIIKRESKAMNKEIENMTDNELALIQLTHLYNKLDKRLDTWVKNVQEMRYKEGGRR